MKHEDLYHTLFEEIRGGKFAAGTRFPSDAQLVRRFGVSRATVLRVVGDLVRNGLLCRRRGSGTFVSARFGYGRIGLLIHGSDYCEFFAFVHQFDVVDGDARDSLDRSSAPEAHKDLTMFGVGLSVKL